MTPTYVCRICSAKSIKESQHQGGSEVTNLPAKELQDVSLVFTIGNDENMALYTYTYTIHTYMMLRREGATEFQLEMAPLVKRSRSV